ncbi:hypothetical protein ATO2_12780 [Roseovarius sp. 22II1-1F6A]|nr:hypothetical protein ATO2_12780 [Roseovarius sp. 22II1-1F6A]
MVFRWMDEPTLGGINAGCGHCWGGFSRVDTAINVFVPVVFSMTRKYAPRIFPATAIWRRLAKCLNEFGAVVHVDVVFIALRCCPKDMLTGHPYLMPVARLVGRKMSCCWRPLEVAHTLWLSHTENKHAFPALRNTEVACVKSNRLI